MAVAEDSTLEAGVPFNQLEGVRQDYDDVEDWLERSEPALKREPDDADMRNLKEHQRALEVTATFT